MPEGNIEIRLDVVVQEVLDPSTEFAFIDLAPFSDGTGRLAVSTIQGTIRVIDGGGNLQPTPLLTKAQSALVLPQEAGMTGIAFHPDFNKVGTFGFGKLYTITTEERARAGGVPLSQVDFPFGEESHQDVIREWDLAAFGGVSGNTANGAFTGTTADSREILRVAQPGPFHNVVDLAFNTNAKPGDADHGLLYITSGDGGNSSGHSNTDRAMSAQDLGTIYGDVLRIDPDPSAHALARTSAHTGEPAYSIPADNPHNGDNPSETRTSSTLAEIWAHGFRSPWRMTFDRATGKMYIGDVGENAREEIDVVEEDSNYGWGRWRAVSTVRSSPGMER